MKQTKDPTRILYITGYYPSNPFDGAGNFIGYLSRHISNIFSKVIVIVPHAPRDPLVYHDNTVQILRYRYIKPERLELLSDKSGLLYAIKKNPLVLFLIPLLIISGFFHAYHIIRRENVILIHSHWILPYGLIGLIISKFFGIPHILSVHGSDISVLPQNPLLRSIIRYILRHTDYITANSTYTARMIKEIGLQKNHPIFTIPMGVDNNRFCFDHDSQSNLTIQNQKQIILFVGRLIPVKGVDILINAMSLVIKEIPSAHLIILGDGPEHINLKKIVNDAFLSPNVSFQGKVTLNELQLWHKRSSVLVLPSHSVHGQTEGLGVVLLEAMASGLPVIGSNTGGIPDIIDNRVNGLLTTPGDPEALAQAIITILSDKKTAECFRRAGIKTVREKFSWDIIAKQFIEVYQKAIT